MDNNGKMVTGWIDLGNQRYFLSPSGAMKTGWINENNTWYYLNNSGAMSKGVININNTSYYLDENGKMLANTTVNVNGTEYNIDGSGVMTPVVANTTQTPESTTSAQTVDDNSGQVYTKASVGPVAR